MAALANGGKTKDENAAELQLGEFNGEMALSNAGKWRARAPASPLSGRSKVTWTRVKSLVARDVAVTNGIGQRLLFSFTAGKLRTKLATERWTRESRVPTPPPPPQVISAARSHMFSLLYFPLTMFFPLDLPASVPLPVPFFFILSLSLSLSLPLSPYLPPCPEILSHTPL